MTIVTNEADDIRRQMAQIRAELHTEMRGVVDGATAATDWRAYISNHPWLAIGVAFGAGFLLIPRRSAPPNVIIQPASSHISDFAVSPHPVAENRFRPWRWAIGVVAPIALRAAQSYALNHVERLLINNPPGPRPAPAPSSTSSVRTPNGEGKVSASRM